MSNLTIYEQIGGAKTVRKLVEAFYQRVQQDPLLAPLFPEELGPVIERQYLFLTQFFGGDPLYTQKRGRPMLRARHLPFPIDQKRADAWLSCMHEALDEVGITGIVRQQIWGRLSQTAYHMINQPE